MESIKNEQNDQLIKLSIHDLAFGIGRKVSDIEWELHLKDTENDVKGFTSEKVLIQIKKEIKKKKTAIQKSLSKI